MESRLALLVALPVKRALPHSARSEASETMPPPVNAADTIPSNGNREILR